MVGSSRFLLKNMTAINDILTRIFLRSCDLDKEDFEEIPGRYFYNRGATYNQYLTLLERDPQQIHRNCHRPMSVQSQGKDVLNLVERFNNEPPRFLARKYNGIKFTRIDIVLMTTRKLFHFQKSKNKLKRGHYRSIKKTYNIGSKSNVHQEVKSKTIYIGNHRSANGAKGMCT